MNFHVEIEQNKIKLKKYLLESNIYNLNTKKYENLKIYNEIKTNITDILNKEESDLVYETNDDDLNEKDFNYLINLVTGKDDIEKKSTFIVIDLGTSSLKSGDSNRPTPFITVNSRLKLIPVIEKKKDEKKKEKKEMFSREMNECCEEKSLSRNFDMEEKECCDDEEEEEDFCQVNDEQILRKDEKVEEKVEKKEKKQLKTTKAKIKIKEWTPDVQYIKDISEKKDIDSKYKKYLEIR
jgi:hypothetical protein